MTERLEKLRKRRGRRPRQQMGSYPRQNSADSQGIWEIAPKRQPRMSSKPWAGGVMNRPRGVMHPDMPKVVKRPMEWRQEDVQGQQWERAWRLAASPWPVRRMGTKENW